MDENKLIEFEWHLENLSFTFNPFHPKCEIKAWLHNTEASKLLNFFLERNEKSRYFEDFFSKDSKILIFFSSFDRKGSLVKINHLNLDGNRDLNIQGIVLHHNSDININNKKVIIVDMKEEKINKKELFEQLLTYSLL